MTNRKSKGVSPIIATVIIVAIAIAIAIAVAFWAVGLTGIFRKAEGVTEDVEIRISANTFQQDERRILQVEVKNIGNTPIVVKEISLFKDGVLIEEMELPEFAEEEILSGKSLGFNFDLSRLGLSLEDRIKVSVKTIYRTDVTIS